MSDAAYGPATYGDDFADVYDDWYCDVSDVEATADTIEELLRASGDGSAATSDATRTDGGRVLELGVGTGRLALAIAAKGIAIDGIDSSAAMLDRLAAKDPQGTVGRLLGDFGTEDFAGDLGEDLGAPGPYRVVFAAYNTFFNLASEQAQLRCLRSVSRRLESDGCLVIEAFLPAEVEEAEAAVNNATAAGSATSPNWPQVETRRLGQSLLLNVSVLDAKQQLVRGRHIEVRLDPADNTTDNTASDIAAADSVANIVSIRSWQIRYLSPSQLDELATRAGLVLTQRWADWQRSPFDAAGTKHVSVYKLAQPGTQNSNTQ